jgi:hypothetical protein
MAWYLLVIIGSSIVMGLTIFGLVGVVVATNYMSKKRVADLSDHVDRIKNLQQ